MTNGEIIQRVFCCEVCEPIPEDDIIHVIFSDKNDSAIGFDLSWWNMDYKEPTTRNCIGCKYSKDNHRAGVEECHLCMWENQYTPTTKNDLEVDCIKKSDAEEYIPRERLKEFVLNIQEIKDAHNENGEPINYGTICGILIDGYERLKMPSFYPKNDTEESHLDEWTKHCHEVIDKSDEFEEWKLNEDKDRYIRIGDILERFKEVDEYFGHDPWTLKQIFSNLNILPSSVFQKFTDEDDCISRKAVLSTLDNMDSALDEDRTVDSYKELLKECYKVLPSVTPQLSSELDKNSQKLEKNFDELDCISRKSVITIIQNHWWNCRDIDKLVNELPSVTPQEPRKGHWIKIGDRGLGWSDTVICKCSECEYQKEFRGKFDGHNLIVDTERADNYCSNCGAKMVEPQENEEGKE